jgi:hypothetical protein
VYINNELYLKLAKVGLMSNIVQKYISIMTKMPIKEFVFRVPAISDLVFSGAVYGVEQSLLLLRVAGGCSAPLRSGATLRIFCSDPLQSAPIRDPPHL